METRNNFIQSGASQGWQCPICKRILSPWTVECPCHGEGWKVTNHFIYGGETTTITMNDKGEIQ